jgi:hypothetical protein
MFIISIGGQNKKTKNMASSQEALQFQGKKKQRRNKVKKTKKQTPFFVLVCHDGYSEYTHTHTYSQSFI